MYRKLFGFLFVLCYSLAIALVIGCFFIQSWHQFLHNVSSQNTALFLISLATYSAILGAIIGVFCFSTFKNHYPDLAWNNLTAFWLVVMTVTAISFFISIGQASWVMSGVALTLLSYVVGLFVGSPIIVALLDETKLGV